MRRLATLMLSALAIATPMPLQASIGSGSSASSASFVVETEAPPGFDELSREREVLVDVYFGGKRVGETRLIASPGVVRLLHPDEITAMVPHVQSPDQVMAALGGDLRSNAAHVCSKENSKECGSLSPGVAGVIYDESFSSRCLHPSNILDRD